MSDVLLKGAIPEPPVILCRDEKARMVMAAHIHYDWSKSPPVIVSEEWPKEWQHVNAVVMTPLVVLGTEAVTSFSIVGDHDISEDARKVLNAYIATCSIKGGPRVGYRDLTTATSLNRRTIIARVKELADAGIGTYKFGTGFELDIGRWRVDARKAEALGIQIEEF